MVPRATLAAALAILVVAWLAACNQQAAGQVVNDEPRSRWPTYMNDLVTINASDGQSDLHKHHHKDPSFDDGPDANTPFKWTGKTITAAVAASVCALLANAAGIGGGPFYVPLFNVVLGFDLKLVTGLSHSVVATGAIGSCIYGLIRPSPVDSNGTLLNFDIALTLIPAMLLGVSFGVLFNPLTPEWLQTALLSVLLVVVVRKTYAKGFKQWREEKKQPGPHQDDEEGGVRESLLEGRNTEDSFNARRRQWGRAVSLVLDKDGVDEHFSNAHIEEHRPSSAAQLVVERAETQIAGIVHRVPWLKAVALLVLWAAFLGLQLEKSHHPHCTWQFAAVAGGQALLLAAVTVAFVYYQAWRASHDPAHVDSEMRKMMTHSLTGENSDVDESDLSNGPRNLVVVTSTVAFSGFVAGLLGIGGALIFNPFLLALGVHPQVVASTAVLIILFSSSSISLSFLFNHMLNVSYVKVFAPIAFVSSLVGVTIVGWAVRKSGRASIIILLMASVILAGTIATVTFGGVRSYHEIQRGEIGFKPFCSI